ncbi:CotH kinase family protein [Telluribacter humicola]|uniref:CotH kinase family protein n=1 Tax=Telluribacter humicola TaxID=1720261 RepID=UPI001A9682B3|nr:CotH kinase family protein [Telluribacter humicola]
MIKNVTAVLLLVLVVAGKAISQTLYINEFMASNASKVADATGAYEDWIEIYNPNSSSVDLAGYYITDNLSNPTKYKIPSGSSATVIPAGGFLLLWASEALDRGPLHVNVRLSAGGEEIGLTAPNGTTVVDSYVFGEQRTDVSFGRNQNGSSQWSFFLEPTPGASNNNSTAYNDILSPPTFSQPAGYSASSFNLTLSSNDPSVTILYTLDGSEPDEANLNGSTFTYKNSYEEVPGQGSGPLLDATLRTYTYSGPISITDRTSQPNRVSMYSSTYQHTAVYLPGFPVFKGTVVRAKAVRQGALASPVVTNTYIVTPNQNQRFTIPVVSLAMSEKDLFGYQDGIYTAGVDFDNWRYGERQTPAYGPAFPGNFRRSGEEWEKEANFEYFAENATGSAINQHIGVRLHGGHTRGYPQKTLRLYSNTYFNYPFFSSVPYTNHKRLLLRNSGNDWRQTMFRDAAIQEMVKHLNFDTQGYKPAILLLNGEYWGIHNIRERYDKYYLNTRYGVNPENLDLIENNGAEVDEGDMVHYNAMFSYMVKNGSSSNEHYSYIQTQMDIDNFIDYQIAEIFAANTDWVENNVRNWRLRTPYQPNAPYGHDGRWRWMMFDTDHGFAGSYSSAEHNTLEFATNEDPNKSPGPARTFILRSLLTNSTFRTAFITRFSDLLNSTYLPERTVPIINTMKQRIQPEIGEHIARWKTSGGVNDWNNEVNIMIDFAQRRPSIMSQQLKNHFSLSDRRSITVNVSNTENGYIKVNTLTILPTTPGVSQNAYPWTGYYFQNVPVTLTAMPKAGYKFVRWQEGNNTISTNPVLVLNLLSDRSVTAVFDLDQGFDSTPSAYILANCDYRFEQWSAESPAGSFPSNMAFVYMNQQDPTVTASIEGFTSGRYNFESRSRVNGLGNDGVSFINTTSNDPSSVNEGFPMGKVGGALLALRTTGLNEVYVQWTAGTLLPNNREYAIRLQYRVGDSGAFQDVLDPQGQPVEYSRNAQAGHSQVMGPVALPAAALNQSYVQLFWRYYMKSGSGSRPQLRLDDIIVSRGRCESLSSGDWNSASRWSCGRIPSICDEVTIRQGHVITLGGDNGKARAIQIEGSGRLDMTASTQLNLGEN